MLERDIIYFSISETSFLLKLVFTFSRHYFSSAWLQKGAVAVAIAVALKSLLICGWRLVTCVERAN